MKSSQKTVICVHLLNDYSGSPLVFSQAIASLIQGGATIELYTNKHQGFLSDLAQVNYHYLPYQWSKNSLITLGYFLYAQLWLIIKFMLTYRKDESVIYINTILPFGAAIAGLFMRKRVIYHVHETSVKPKALKRFLFWIANKAASDIIYVSDYLRQAEPLKQATNHRVYNTLPLDFTRKASVFERYPRTKFHVLMLCSLKTYKGVNEYVELARAMPTYQFTLVLNSSWEDIQSFFWQDPIWPENLTVFPTQPDVHSFYQKADLILNLSHPESWIETFGMTILEGMTYGLPAIVPPVGGVTALINDGWNGYHIHPKNSEALQQAIQALATQPKLYNKFHHNAYKKYKTFSRRNFSQQINHIVLTHLNLRNPYTKEKSNYTKTNITH